jgi:hypothetical protein
LKCSVFFLAKGIKYNTEKGESTMKKENKVAKMVKKIAVASARNAVNKKYVIMLYEHEATDAVKKALTEMQM